MFIYHHRNLGFWGFTGWRIQKPTCFLQSPRNGTDRCYKSCVGNIYQELNTILRHPSSLDFTDEKLCLSVWFLKEVVTSSRGLRLLTLLTHRLSHPYVGSSWPFCLFHPLPHSLSLALSVWEASQQSPVFLVLEKKEEFLVLEKKILVSLFFLKDFFP